MPNLAEPRGRTLRAFLQTKVVYQGTCADKSTSWSLARRLESLLSVLPDGCLEELTQVPDGLLVFSDDRNDYNRGRQEVGGVLLRGVATVRGPSFLTDAGSGLEIVARWLDHYLGSRFESESLLSDAPPGVPGWDDFHHRLAAASANGYADHAAAQESPGAYLAWAFCAYLTEPRRLSYVDPPGHGLLRSTLFSEAFWRRYPRRPRPTTDGIV